MSGGRYGLAEDRKLSANREATRVLFVSFSFFVCFVFLLFGFQFYAPDTNTQVWG